MSFQILDGRKCSDKILSELKKNIIESGQWLGLAIIQVGDDEASSIYIKYKRMACEKIGINFTLCKYPVNITNEDLMSSIDDINGNDKITGCIIQLPLPEHLDKQMLLDRIDPKKDVDGLHSVNLGRLAMGYPTFVPATPLGIGKLIEHHRIDTQGKCCVILGKSNIVGKPLQLLLSNEIGPACTTIFCDKYTQDIEKYLKLADILVVAVGKHHFIHKPEVLKEGVVIVDVGIHRVIREGKNRVEGDVNFEAVKNRCSYITPVPGGIGPMTVSALMYNIYHSSEFGLKD